MIIPVVAFTFLLTHHMGGDIDMTVALWVVFGLAFMDWAIKQVSP